MNLNKSIIVGRLTRDPERHQTTGGAVVVKFGIAFDDGFGEYKKIVFMDVTTWNKSAEFVAHYCTKGDPVLIDGRISMDTWEDKNDGHRRSKIYLTADNVQLLKRKIKQEEAPVEVQAPTKGDDGTFF